MSKNKNSIWSFFASVKLALFVLFLLAAASVIGTIIPQNSPAEEYVKLYGPNMARLFQILDISDMYNSWWFTLLLILLGLNLTICTIERLPNVWRLMVQDNLATDPGRLAAAPSSQKLRTAMPLDEAAAKARASLAENGWHATEAKREGGILLFAQKGAWTRLGVYVVHSSILIIFAGALIGSHFGYKGSVMIPETRSIDAIYSFGNGKEIKLGFEVLCKRFTLEKYPNGAPKEFKSDLAIVENGKEVLTKSIEVNDPLTYKGNTFYQASYQSYHKFFVSLSDNQTKKSEKFLIEPGREINWAGEDVSFGIINRQLDDKSMKYSYKIWFKGGGVAVPFWITDGDTTTVKSGDKEYTFALKEFYATGLQVTKDPGVWYVYAGCILMLLGLMVAFFLSHRRIWVYLTRENDETSVLISGNTSKNKLALEKNLAKVGDSINQKIAGLS